MTRDTQRAGTEAARRRPWTSLVMVGTVLMAVLVSTAVGATARTVTGTTARPGHGKPTVTATATASTTPPAPPSPTTTASATASITATPTASATPTPTASTTPTPTAISCQLGTVVLGGATWCVATVDQVADDAFPAGTRVALVGAPVEWADATHVYVTGSADPCPPGYFCGAAGVRVAAIDISRIASPTIGYTVDAWGTTQPGGVLLAVGIRSAS
jgi:hypothetical protein